MNDFMKATDAIVNVFVCSTCDFVVLPEIAKTGAVIKGREGEFCPRCECKYESRNLQIIKVNKIINQAIAMIICFFKTRTFLLILGLYLLSRLL